MTCDSCVATFIPFNDHVLHSNGSMPDSLPIRPLHTAISTNYWKIVADTRELHIKSIKALLKEKLEDKGVKEREKVKNVREI